MRIKHFILYYINTCFIVYLYNEYQFIYALQYIRAFPHFVLNGRFCKVLSKNAEAYLGKGRKIIYFVRCCLIFFRKNL